MVLKYALASLLFGSVVAQDDCDSSSSPGIALVQRHASLSTDKEEDATDRCALVEHHPTDVIHVATNNGYDQHSEVNCPSNQVLAGVWSHHDNGAEDRVWKYACAPFTAKTGYLTPYLGGCSGWTGATGWDATWTSPGDGRTNQVITNVKSWHDNGREDRQFSFRYCTVYNVGASSLVGDGNWRNGWDGDLGLNLPTTEFFYQWTSTHDNGREDRLFKFIRYKFCMAVAPTPNPTPNPTANPTAFPTTPSPTKPPKACESWCQYDTRDWRTKCGWNPCNLCTDCGTHTGHCAQWCHHDTRDWETKCSWGTVCGECSGCGH